MRQLDGARWTGRAADAARAQVSRRVADLLDAATRHDRAGDALTRHAAEVERCRSLLRRAAEVLS